MVQFCLILFMENYGHECIKTFITGTLTNAHFFVVAGFWMMFCFLLGSFLCCLHFFTTSMCYFYKDIRAILYVGRIMFCLSFFGGEMYF